MTKFTTKKIAGIILSAFIIMSAIFSIALFKKDTGAVVYAAVDSVFDSFDDYDTGYDRSGRANGIYEQIITWGSNTGTNIAEAGNPIGTDTGKSLRLKQTSNGLFIVWGQGTKDPDKINQTGAKYIKFYIRNLSAQAREMGIIVTDILQSTIDLFASAGNTTPDYGQEHWMLAWNQPAVLETLNGEKSIVKSVNGNYVLIPKDFEGTLSVPLDSKYLVRPDWWLQEGHTYGNGELDLDKIFIASVFFPELSDGISFDDSDTWSVFEIDNVMFCSDNSVAEYLEQNGGNEENEAKSIVKPINDNIKVDFNELTISVKKGITKDEFISGFQLDEDVKVVLKDPFGFVISSGSQELQNDSMIEFMKGIKKYTFRLKVTSDDKPKSTAGCGSVINIINNPTAFTLLFLTAIFSAFLLLSKKERKEKELGYEK